MGISISQIIFLNPCIKIPAPFSWHQEERALLNLFHFLFLYVAEGSPAARAAYLSCQPSSICSTSSSSQADVAGERFAYWCLSTGLFIHTGHIDSGLIFALVAFHAEQREAALVQGSCINALQTTEINRPISTNSKDSRAHNIGIGINQTTTLLETWVLLIIMYLFYIYIIISTNHIYVFIFISIHLCIWCRYVFFR